MVAGTTAFLDYVLSLESVTSEETTETITPLEFLWRNLGGNADVDVFLPDPRGRAPQLQVLHLNRSVQRLGVRITQYIATCFNHETQEFTTVTMRQSQSLLVVA